MGREEGHGKAQDHVEKCLVIWVGASPGFPLVRAGGRRKLQEKGKLHSVLCSSPLNPLNFRETIFKRVIKHMKRSLEGVLI